MILVPSSESRLGNEGIHRNTTLNEREGKFIFSFIRVGIRRSEAAIKLRHFNFLPRFAK
jgi:hypothetical protein